MKKIMCILCILFFASTAYAGYRSTDGSYHVGDTVSISQYSDNLSTALAAIGSDDKELIINETIALTAHCVVPATCKIRFTKGGIITLGDYNLTINSPFRCDRQYIFNATGTGVVAFGADSVKEILPEWFGTADDDVVLQDVIDALGASSIPLYFSQGTWDIDASLTFVATTTMKFDKGAILDVNDGITVAIGGYVDAGPYKIFDVDANSTVSLADTTIDVYSTWFDENLTAAVGSIASYDQILHITDSTLNSSIAIAKDIKIVLECDATSTLSASAIFDVDGVLSESTYALSADEDEGSESVVVASATGLAVGDYIYFRQPQTTAYVDSHYRIVSIADTTLTLDRDLDIDADSNCIIYEHTPYRFNFDGNGKTVSMSGDRPQFINMVHSRDSKISDTHLYFSGNEPTTSSSVIIPVFVDKCYGITIENMTFKNLDGGENFSCLGVYRSSGIDVDNIFIPGTKGKAGGLVFLYNTQGNVHHCRLFKVQTSGTGVIFSYLCHYFDINNNIIHSSTYHAADTSGSGIQITACVNVNCNNNTVANCRGIAEIYVSGSSDRVNITGNIISHSGVGTNDYKSAIQLRSGTNIKCNSNLIETDGATGIHLRGIDGYSLQNNTVICTGIHGLLLTKAGSDADEATYYPSNGIVSGNDIKLTNAVATCTGLNLGSKAYENKICDNKIEYTSTSVAAGNKWGMLLNTADTKTAVHDNYIYTAITDANFPIIGIQLSSFAGAFWNNMVEGDNDTPYTFTTPTGYGHDNWSVGSNLGYGYVAAVINTKTFAGTCARKMGTTAARPTLGAADAGFIYWDTNLTEAIVWNGSGWVACDGTGL